MWATLAVLRNQMSILVKQRFVLRMSPSGVILWENYLYYHNAVSTTSDSVDSVCGNTNYVYAFYSYTYDYSVQGIVKLTYSEGRTVWIK